MAVKRFKRLSRKKPKELEVDITSLLDILVILLVFLLKSYNPTDLKLDVVKNLTLPNSESKTLGHTATTVQVSAQKEFWIDNKKIGTLSITGTEKFDQLFNELVKRKEIQDKKESMRTVASTKEQKKNNKINLVFDQSLPYEVIQKIMHTSSIAGYTEYKFIVQGKY